MPYAQQCGAGPVHPSPLLLGCGPALSPLPSSRCSLGDKAGLVGGWGQARGNLSSATDPLGGLGHVLFPLSVPQFPRPQNEEDSIHHPGPGGDGGGSCQATHRLLLQCWQRRNRDWTSPLFPKLGTGSGPSGRVTKQGERNKRCSIKGQSKGSLICRPFTRPEEGRGCRWGILA